MGLVTTWLNGIGLARAVPAFQQAGITNPESLSMLELDEYEALGVTEPNDRKKLFYLVQRIKMAVDKSEEQQKNDNKITDGADDRMETRRQTGKSQKLKSVSRSRKNDKISRSKKGSSFHSDEETEQSNGGRIGIDDVDEGAELSHLEGCRGSDESDNEEDATWSSSWEDVSPSSTVPSPPQSLSNDDASAESLVQSEQEDSEYESENFDYYPSKPRSRKRSPKRKEEQLASFDEYSDDSDFDGEENDGEWENNQQSHSRRTNVRYNPQKKVDTKRTPKKTTLSFEKTTRRHPKVKQTCKPKSQRREEKRKVNHPKSIDKRRGRHRRSPSPKRTEQLHDDDQSNSSVESREEETKSYFEFDSESEHSCSDEEERFLLQKLEERRRSRRLKNRYVEDDPPSAVSSISSSSSRIKLQNKQGSSASRKKTISRTESDNSIASNHLDPAHRRRSNSTSKIKRNEYGSEKSSSRSACLSSSPENNRREIATTETKSERPSRRESQQLRRRSNNIPSPDNESDSPSRNSKKVSNTSVRDDSKNNVEANESYDSYDSSTMRNRSRLQKSKLQNPSACNRRNLGGRTKSSRLSSIPSDAVAPISPLQDRFSNFDEIKKKEDKQQNKLQRNGRRSIGEMPTKGKRNTVTSDRDKRRSSLSNSATENADRGNRTGRGIQKPSSVSRTVRKKRISMNGRTTSTPSPSPTPSTKRINQHMNRTASKSKRVNTLTSGEDEMNVSVASAAVFIHGEAEDDSWATQVARLREDKESEIAAYDHYEDDDENMRIRVVVRKRPMSRREASSNEVDVIHPFEQNGRIFVYQPKTRVDLTKEIETLPFAFDNVFEDCSSNADIHDRSTRNLIPGVFEGKWVSVFAYGQTGSGKTFTMMGSNMTGMKAGNSNNNKELNANLGLYFLAAQDVFRYTSFEQFSHLSVSVSLFEIYGGKLFDLLNKRKPVKCLEDSRGKVCFPGLSAHGVQSPEELMDVIEAGAANRSMGSTSANADSSRSHAILQISLRKQVGRRSNVEHGRLTFVDLAGSERGADTNEASRTTRLEGAEINTSLLALKEVIRALATGGTMQHIPFRGSKLTQVLKESFVGKNSRTVMVACVAPNLSNCEHTMNTLRYADRVKERNPESGLSAVGPQPRKGRENRRFSSDKSSSVLRSSSAPASARKAPTEKTGDRDNVSCASGQHRRTQRDYLHGTSEDWEEEEDVGSGMVEDSWEDEELTEEDIEATKEDSSDVESEPPMPPSPETSDEDREMAVMPEPKLDEKSNHKEEDTAKRNDQKSAQDQIREACKPLIANHRATMTGMLSMVKNEMSLVNCTDADRDRIEEYTKELELLQDKKLNMIASLRESLLEFYSTRDLIYKKNSPRPSTAPPNTHHASAELSEDSLSDFEDLRD